MYQIAALQQVIADTFAALVLICCVAVIDRTHDKVLGAGATLLRIPVHYLFETAHLAVLLAWTLRCILTAFQMVSSTH